MSDAVPVPASEFVRMRKLLDQQEIADCQARIARGADRFDRELYLSACHADAQVSVAGRTRSVAESFEGGKAGHDAGSVGTLHCLSTSNCDINGDVAHVETYHIYCARTKDEASWAAAGRYLDQFKRRDGVWGLVFRHISVEWTGQMTPFDLPLLTPQDAPKQRLSSSRDRGDVPYLRPLKA